jgi:hypothetical protein
MEQLQKDMVTAMKAHDKVRKDAISSLISAVKKIAIDEAVDILGGIGNLHSYKKCGCKAQLEPVSEGCEKVYSTMTFRNTLPCVGKRSRYLQKNFSLS